MLNKFWESIGSNVAERWLDYILGPAFLFWVGGFGLYVWKTGWQLLLKEFQMLTQFQQASWIVLALFILVLSSVLMQAIRFPILRLLEGYWPWPLNFLGLKIVALKKPSFKKRNAELRNLMKILESEGKLDAGQREKLNRLDFLVHWQPVQSEDLLPTDLGNILRAREYSPERKYGLDAIVCWPRLWPLLPENIRMDLAKARSALDRLTEFWFWGLLFLLWTFLVRWAAIIGLIWVFVTYRIACQSARAYGDLL
jgi:hypothetical protein